MTTGARERVALGPGREFERIRAILRDLPDLHTAVEVGPGDDAAVLTNGTVLSTDLGIEGVHFRLDWISATEAGYRTAAAGVSDLAAMAAEPVGILVSLGAPGDGALAEELMAGVKSLAREFGMTLLGGDLTRSPGPLIVDIVSIGHVPKPLLRSGAKVGDEVWVTGTLGGAAAGVALWEAGQTVPETLRQAFAAPRPRIDEARWLLEAGATAGIDLSDGLAGDAGHIAAASEVAVVIDSNALPLHSELADLQLPEGISPSDLALRGGDDFELLVAAPQGLLDGRVVEFVRRFDLGLTRVGRVIEGVGVMLGSEDSDAATRRTRGGYDNFSRELPS